jgi:hypothetical protein
VTGTAGPVVGFAEDVGQTVQLDPELARILDDTGAVLDHARDRAGREGTQRRFPRQCGKHSCVGKVASVGTIHTRLKVDGHLEQLAEVRIELVQEVIEQPVTHEDDLDVERNRFGVERHRADETQGFAE